MCFYTKELWQQRRQTQGGSDGGIELRHCPAYLQLYFKLSLIRQLRQNCERQLNTLNPWLVSEQIFLIVSGVRLTFFVTYMAAVQPRLSIVTELETVFDKRCSNCPLVH